MSENGHAKNVESLKSARDFATSWGAKYSPSNPVLAISNMTAVITLAEPLLDDVIAAKTPYRNATAAAQDVFAPLNELITRVMRSLAASGVPQSVIDDAKTYSRKIKGQRATPKPKDDPSTPEFDESAKAHSAAQLSRTQRIESLDSLISLLDSNSLYSPNEVPLQVGTLTDLSTDLKTKVAAVQANFIELSNKRVARDEVLYGKDTGLVEIGRKFRTYVQSFGRNSPEWNQVKSLEFSSPRK